MPEYTREDMATVNVVADAMTNPALGLDRLVCLGDIIKALKADGFADAAEHLKVAQAEAQESLDA